jgi:hypothetical protein
MRESRIQRYMNHHQIDSSISGSLPDLSAVTDSECQIWRVEIKPVNRLTAYQAASAIQEFSQACGVEMSYAEALSVAEQAKQTLPVAIAALQAAGVQVTSDRLTDLLCGALADYIERRRQ